MAYLRRLHSGLGLVAIGGSLSLSLWAFYELILGWLYSTFGYTPWYVYHSIHTPLLLSGVGIAILGLYLFASPDRPIEEGARPTRSRKVLRLSLMGIVATGALWWGVWLTPAPGVNPPAFLYYIGPSAAFVLAAMTAIIVSMLRMRYVAERLGSSKLARLANVLARWIPIASILGFMLVVLLFWYLSPPVIMYTRVRELMMKLPFVPAFLCAVMYLGLALRIRHRLGVQIREGRERIYA